MIEPHFRGRSRGLGLAITAVLGLSALGACTDPEQRSDLRPAGPPEVLSVLVMNDPDLYLETATFCKLNDALRPTEVFLVIGGLTEVCPLDETKPATMVEDAVPTGWYVRVVFDELLNPDIEELIPNTDSGGEPTGTFTGSIANTHPVTLTCGGVDVPYDGYYSPGGNYQTWPVGPSLVIIPDDPTSVPGGTECTVTLAANIKDKSGEEVPMAQRGMAGEYKFAVAPFELVSTDPGSIATDMTDDKEEVVPESPITLQFNSVVDPATVTTADVHLFKGVAADCTGGTEVAAASVRIFQILDDAPPDGVVADETTIQIADGSATGAVTDPTDPTLDGLFFDENETYRLEFSAGAEASDAAGGTGSLELEMDTVLCFDTDMAAP
jgi:hypothetical protein